MSCIDLDKAKENLSAYLQSKDKDLNKDQADILATTGVEFAKEAGRLVLQKVGSKAGQAIRSHNSQPKVVKKGVKGEEFMRYQKNFVLKSDWKNWNKYI